jgi:hypothetical protein
MYRLVSFGATTALSAAEQAQVDAVIAVLPKCYTQELHDCFNKRSMEQPGCEIIQKYYTVEPTPVSNAIDEYIKSDKMPYCSQQNLLRSPLGYALIGGAAILGVAIGIMIPKR